MEKNLNSNSGNKNYHQFRPELFSDDSEFEDIHFKAITDGLGFHHGEKRSDGSQFKNKPSQKLKSSVPAVKKTINQTNSTQNSHYMNGLEAFYKEEKSLAVQKPITEKVVTSRPKTKKIIITRANIAERAFAYITDIFLIVAFMAFTFGTIFIASGIQYELIFKLLTMEEIVSYSMGIFALNYLLYFTILDVKATPGKLLMGIKIIRSNGKSSSATLAFLRAVISLILLPAFVMLGLGIQDKILSLKVIVDEEAK